MTLDQAQSTVERLNALKNRISRQAWAIDEALFRLRLAKVGESGISHRTIEAVEDAEKRLAAVVPAAEAEVVRLCMEYLNVDATA